MGDDEQQAEPAVWEPWQPQMGQRVRLRPSGECLLQHPVAARLDAACGFVAQIDRSERDGHFYRVTIDHPELFAEPWMHLYGPWCCALELEPVDG